MHIPFNKPYMTGKELWYISQAHAAGHLAGDGQFTRKCNAWLEQRIGAKKALLTHSCTIDGGISPPQFPLQGKRLLRRSPRGSDLSGSAQKLNNRPAARPLLTQRRLCRLASGDDRIGS